MRITTEEVTANLWPAIEELFGANGACGGCWCQAWRIERGERWGDIKGTTAKARLRRGVQRGTTLGIVAFEGRQPVGWCTFGPRNSFPRLNRAPSLKCDDSSQVWSVPCFFVKRDFRGRGVASALLKHAVKVMQRMGIETVEGYPVKPDKEGQYIAAFSWTGTRPLFYKEGFVVVGNRNGSKQRVRKTLVHSRRETIVTPTKAQV